MSVKFDKGDETTLTVCNEEIGEDEAEMMDDMVVVVLVIMLFDMVENILDIVDSAVLGSDLGVVLDENANNMDDKVQLL